MEQKMKMGWKKYLLIASLGVNLLITFAVGGAFLKTGKPDGHKTGVFLQGAMMRALPDEQRKALHGNFREQRKGKKPKGGELGGLRTELKNVITAVPFDADALGLVLNKQREMRSGFAQGGDDALIEVITQMSDDERATFADNIKFRKFKRKKK